MRCRALLGATCCLALAGVARAQPTGNLHGTVISDQGERLPGVEITLSGLGAARSRTSDGAGRFRFLGLDPGRYTVEAVLEGFASLEFPDIEIRIGRNVDLRLELRPAVKETITVVAESPLLDERRLAPGITVTEVEIEKIPAHRNPLTFLQQTPEVLVDRIEVAGNESQNVTIFRAQGLPPAENDFLLDGVQATDMASTGFTTFSVDLDQYAEMSFTTGGTDVTKNSAGVAVNLVTKRGSNEFRGSARFYKVEADGYFGGALEQAEPDIENELYTEGGQTELVGTRMISREDAGFEAGGPVLYDRLWLWGAWSRNDIEQSDAAGQGHPVRFEHATVKLNAQLSPANSLVASWNHSTKERDGWRSSITQTPEASWDERGPSAIYRFEDSHVFSSSLFVTGSYTLIDHGYSLLARGPADVENGLDPAAPDPVFGPDGLWQDNFLSGFGRGDQDQFKIDASYFLGAGKVKHELKIGGRLRTVEFHELFKWGPRNVFQTFWGTSVAGHSQAGPATNEYLSFWVQDTISIGNLTLNAGLRYDDQTGSSSPATIEPHAVYPEVLPGFTVEGEENVSWESLEPRVGLTYALGEDRDTLLRASFSRFASQLGTATSNWTSLTSATWYGYFYSGYLYAAYGFDPLDPLVSANRYADAFDPETTSELILEVEHAILPEFVVGARATWRRTEDVIDRVQMVRDGEGGARPATPDDYEIVGTVSGTIPRMDASYSVPVWDLVGQKSPFDPSDGAPTGGLMLVNGPRVREFSGASVTFTKRLSNRWMARGFLNYGDAEWKSVPERYVGCPQGGGPNNQKGGGCRNGDLYMVGSNFLGRGERFVQATWSFNLNGMLQIAPERPWGFNLSANLFGREAHPVAYSHRFGTTLGSTDVNVIEAFDDIRLAHDPLNLDLRIEKEFAATKPVSLVFGIDAFNVLNNTDGVSYAGRTDLPTAGYLLDTISPRTWQLGVRVKWK